MNKSRLNGPTRRAESRFSTNHRRSFFSVDSPSQRVPLEAKSFKVASRSAGAARLTESRRRSVVRAHETCADPFPALSHPQPRIPDHPAHPHDGDTLEYRMIPAPRSSVRSSGC